MALQEKEDQIQFTKLKLLEKKQEITHLQQLTDGNKKSFKSLQDQIQKSGGEIQLSNLEEKIQEIENEIEI